MKKFIAIISAFILIFLAVTALADEPEHVEVVGFRYERNDDYYLLKGWISKLDYEHDEVYVTDYDGEVWILYGIEDWCLGDVIIMLMSTEGTDDIEDDWILDVMWTGINRFCD